MFAIQIPTVIPLKNMWKKSYLPYKNLLKNFSNVLRFQKLTSSPYIPIHSVPLTIYFPLKQHIESKKSGTYLQIALSNSEPLTIRKPQRWGWNFSPWNGNYIRCELATPTPVFNNAMLLLPFFRNLEYRTRQRLSKNATQSRNRSIPSKRCSQTWLPRLELSTPFQFS